ncbi:tRNA (adenosine(37)-N6)-threonylcarbamoyltransferase complex ATPase subunit type 1 TsaE [Rhodobacteraceae bacterium RKSG542]|uniref:tRNA (adenosine(37)-N6)-threonylcarbamoyltransferase complex ATPase subunit type 1 TsaE n=1 Tax=Pseudovibrio flavus TaxID=2529854 RepID=UPI0012BD1E7B|nr:tRNA (adenosine(37)-N6)-threonylcarbamoyltransferase complex ATPase subunit type 1 TsaE [Pseudovibrio flavus]MTI17804.1 tRNA (adenosine(37)-N6)-threonylcarbamoyltransferase complex ATPase subunit type 1 TsaE [Pseudovibrio flavus]
MQIELKDQQATELFAADLAELLKNGDVIALSGDLGTGKSTLSRALLRHMAADPALEVPSPTFTLVQTYSLPRMSIAHFDLYRIEEPEELDELGLEEYLEEGVALIEWPEMGDPSYWPDALEIKLEEGIEPDTRVLTLYANSDDWEQRLDRLAARRALIENAGWQNAERTHVKGDASTRAYLRLSRDGETAILMDNPARHGEPALHSGKTYAQLVHLAADIKPFIAIAEELKRQGFVVPNILAADIESGMALLSDLGNDFIVVDGKPVEERYEASIDVLAAMHSRALPEVIESELAGSVTMPTYDAQALVTECELFLDWYLPYLINATASPEQRAAFGDAWRDALAPLEASPKTWVLRDYHSPNLLWDQNAEGTDRIGIIDFQDAQLGHPAYDVASLVYDARFDVPQDMRERLVNRYCAARAASEPAFDEAAFRYALAVCAAQRNTKILGGFVRLDRAFGKPTYLKELDRIRCYLDDALAHPQLKNLKQLLDVILLSKQL